MRKGKGEMCELLALLCGDGLAKKVNKREIVSDDKDEEVKSRTLMDLLFCLRGS